MNSETAEKGTERKQAKPSYLNYNASKEQAGIHSPNNFENCWKPSERNALHREKVNVTCHYSNNIYLLWRILIK